MLIPGSSTCCNKRNRQGCKCTTTTKGGEGRGGMGCGRSCACPPSLGTVRGGKQQTRGMDFLYREESCFPPRSSPVPQEIVGEKKKKINHPHTPRACPAEPDTQSGPQPLCGLPPLPSPGKSPGPARPRRCSRARGRESTKERGPVRGGGAGGGGGPRTPRGPGLPHYCPLAGSAVAATAGVRAAESRRD